MKIKYSNFHLLLGKRRSIKISFTVNLRDQNIVLIYCFLWAQNELRNEKRKKYLRELILMLFGHSIIVLPF